MRCCLLIPFAVSPGCFRLRASARALSTSRTLAVELEALHCITHSRFHPSGAPQASATARVFSKNAAVATQRTLGQCCCRMAVCVTWAVHVPPQPLRTAPDNMRRNNKLHGTIALFSVVFRFIYVKRCPMRRRVKSL